MNKDRLIQLVVVLLAVVLLGGTAFTIPPINSQRRELRLTYDPVVGDDMPPHVAMATVASGAFRGILVDWWWYRAEMQKRDGKFDEANTLSNWIVSMQPRYAQVWSFNAWNQAYNISVQTFTPEERWDWVSKGERQLREGGIPYNPDAVLLYKELAWIWFHKIGGNTDDFHNYYKLQVATEWQDLLGPPPPGQDKEIVLRWFEPIRDNAERYFLFGRPSGEMIALIDKLEAAADTPEQKDAIAKLRDMDVLRLVAALDRPKRFVQMFGDQARYDEAALARINELKALAADAAERSKRDPLSVLFEDSPQAQPLVEAMDQLGYKLGNEEVLKTAARLGELAAAVRYYPAAQLVAWAESRLSPNDQQLLRLMLDPQREQQWRALLPFIRARAVTKGKHMDAGKMYEFMEEYGPIDWRHPLAHALYWSRMGVEKAGILTDKSKIDQLNTYRGIIHALQTMTHQGRVNFDRFAYNEWTGRFGRVSYQPDPRFMDSYLAAVMGGGDWISDTEGRIDWGSGVISSFEAGHENFLQVAVTYAFLYGEPERAQRYYAELKERYGDKDHNKRSGQYNLPMEQFVSSTFLEEGDMKKLNEGFINALINSAIAEGLAMRRLDTFNRFLAIAKASYDRYNEMRANPKSAVYAGEERLAFKDFKTEMVPAVFGDFLSDPGLPLDIRRTAYRFAPPELQKLVYLKFYRNVLDQLTQGLAGQPDAPDPQLLMDRYFPKPRGLEIPQAPVDQPEGPATTIERQ